MKNSRPLLLSRPMVIAGLLGSFALLAGTALFSSIATRSLAKAGERVTQTQDTLLQINQLRASLVDAETGQRGYILTGLDSYLAPYDRATASLGSQLAALRARLADSPEQIATLDRIDGLVKTKAAEMSRTIELRRASTVGPALHILDSGAGLATMNALRASVGEMERREFIELSLYSSGAARRSQAYQAAGFAMLFVAAGLTGLGAWLSMRRVNELESMITVCAWTRRVKFNGNWVSFEDYLHERFNLEFTHGISEEAAKKLKMEAIELVESDPSRFKARQSAAAGAAKNGSAPGPANHPPATAPAQNGPAHRPAIKPV